MNVIAIFEGRFEAVYTWTIDVFTLLRNGTRKGPAGGRYGGRTVLCRVSDVLARYVNRHR
jgi:hypothetical protein